MSLADLWKSNQDQAQGKNVSQIIGWAGVGKLGDGNDTSVEFRHFLSIVPSAVLLGYVNDCLTLKFDQGGFALQDLVNEIGRRLDFQVKNGLYRGKQGAIGFDGLWTTKEHQLVIEVKTTDVYRIDLEDLAVYRRKLVKAGEVSEQSSSILIVVGRQDTGDLESQIRGSRYAWDIRLISVDSLAKLLQVKEDIEDPAIVSKICNILIPQEFTKVDGIVDLVFSAAEDLSDVVEPDPQAPDPQPSENGGEPKRARKAKAKTQSSVSFYEECLSKVSAKLGLTFVKKSRSIYKAPNGVLLSVALSKQHERYSNPHYWFSFNSHQQSQLQESDVAYASFGCGSSSKVALIPYKDLVQFLPKLFTTVDSVRQVWHVPVEMIGNDWILLTRGGNESINISKYVF